MPYKRKKGICGVDSRCDAQREEVLQDTQYQDRGVSLGIRNKKAPEKDLMTPLESLTLIEWATKYLEYSKVKFAALTFNEKRFVFKRFFKRLIRLCPLRI